MKMFPTVLFLVFVFKKLQRERSYFCPRLFRERGGRLDDQAQLIEKEPLKASFVWGKTASPGPVVPVPTLGSWIEEDLGPVMTEKPTILTTIKLTSIKI